MLLRGVNPVALLREILGRPDGLCGGAAGQMHLMSKPHLSLASGIVGASGPAGIGLALSGQTLRAGSLALAFFGEAATNQGMLLESLNLAAAWKLPVVFVCKDNGWAITTQTERSTRGSPAARARSFGIEAVSGNGLDVEEVFSLAAHAIEHVRTGRGPYFLHLSCSHLEGHFLGDPLLRLQRQPAQEIGWVARPLLKGLFTSRGSSLRLRWDGLKQLTSSIIASFRQNRKLQDPVKITREKLSGEGDKLAQLEDEIEDKVAYLVKRTLLEKRGT